MGFVEIPIFTGNCLRQWINWSEDFFHREDYKEIEKLNFAQSFIDDNAQIWFRRMNSMLQFQNWRELKNTLILKFGDDDDAESMGSGCSTEPIYDVYVDDQSTMDSIDGVGNPTYDVFGIQKGEVMNLVTTKRQRNGFGKLTPIPRELILNSAQTRSLRSCGTPKLNMADESHYSSDWYTNKRKYKKQTAPSRLTGIPTYFSSGLILFASPDSAIAIVPPPFFNNSVPPPMDKIQMGKASISRKRPFDRGKQDFLKNLEDKVLFEDGCIDGIE